MTNGSTEESKKKEPGARELLRELTESLVIAAKTAEKLSKSERYRAFGIVRDDALELVTRLHSDFVYLKQEARNTQAADFAGQGAA